ncbi:MAG TPA: Nramp family divalent metal transporter [Ktedonobacterales bacterium]|nr:Nramp family divalent metal transporter [Ktedonobacterales bacterium]
MTSEQTQAPERDTAKRRVPRRRLPHRGRPEPLPGIRRWLRVLGPGLITGAADDDPSGIGTYSQAGAAFGMGLLWLALYLLPLVIAVQEMCGRIGLVCGKGIAGVIRRHYSRKVLFGAVSLLFIANTINVGADLGAMAASVQLLAPGLPFRWLLVGFAFSTLLLEIFIPYRYYARVLKVLTLSLLAYVITGIIVQPDWLALLRDTVLPQISFTPAYLALVIAVIGTTISPYLFFWQASEEVEETELRHPHMKDDPSLRSHVRRWIRALRVDTAWGLFAASATFWFIVVTTGVTLHSHGNIRNITTAAQAAQALQPLAGDFAGVFFALGIIGTGLLAVPVLAGSAAYGIAEAFGWREGLGETLNHARGFYTVIAASTLVGLGLNFLGIDPIAALVYTAVINGIVAVPLLILILLAANNRTIMGDFHNRWLSNVLGILTTLLVTAAGVALLVTLVHP